MSLYFCARLQELSYCQTVVLSVTDDVGVRTIMDDLLSSCHNPEPSIRCAAVTILKAFCEQTKVDYTDYVPQLFRGLIHLLTDSDEKVLHASWDCLNAITKVSAALCIVVSLASAGLVFHLP